MIWKVLCLLNAVAYTIMAFNWLGVTLGYVATPTSDMLNNAICALAFGAAPLWAMMALRDKGP